MKTILEKISDNFKENQLKVILQNNPMKDDYHTGIRTTNDIKTWEEVLNDNDDEGFTYPDNSKKIFIGKNRITIYSSYEIHLGTFVTTSKMMAQDYAGNKNNIFKKTINPMEVAWINGDEGIYVGQV